MASIFVSVASFCDPHLMFTLDCMFSACSQKHVICVGLVNQTPAPEYMPWTARAYAPCIRAVSMHSSQSRGTCWARYICQSMYAGEDYYLQIDSHTLFDENWDDSLVNLHQCAEDRSIISTYPVPFTFQNGKAVRDHVNLSKDHVMIMKPASLDISADNVCMTFHANYTKTDKLFVPGFHVAGGFMFTRGNFVEQVPYDPQLYFAGEEQCMAARAYTHGWDIVHPRYQDVPLFHLYKSPDVDLAEHHWNPKHDAMRHHKWHELNHHSIKRCTALLRETSNLASFGLGRTRSMDEFAAFSGINYKQLTVIPKDYC